MVKVKVYPKMKFYIKHILIKLQIIIMKILNIIKIHIIPLTIRLKYGWITTLNERIKLINELFKQSKKDSFYISKRILIWEPAPYPVHISIASCIGTSLLLRGCDVEQVICDGTPVACNARSVTNSESFSDWGEKCLFCYKACENEAKGFNIKTCSLGKLLTSEKLIEFEKLSQTIKIEDINDYKYKGINLGKYTLSALSRYYKGKIIEFEESLLRKYFFSTLVIAESSIRKIESFKPDVIYLSHAIYNTWGPAFKVAMQKGIPVVKLGGGYQRAFTYFRKIVGGDNVHQGLISDSGWEDRKVKSLSRKENEILDNYFKDRYIKKKNSDIPMLEKPNDDINDVLSKFNITNSKPIWCIFTNVAWDASIDVAPMAFKSPSDWLVETIKTIIEISDIQWLIKIHPTEATSETVQGAQDIIKNNFKTLPSNIQIISPLANVSPYDIYRIIKGGITCFGNTSGLELAMLGKPMIVAGESIYAKKGFTYDGLTPAKYLNYLKKVPNIPLLTEKQKGDARKLAFSYFIQRQIPLRMFNIENNHFHSFNWGKVELLLPGKDLVMDMVCERFFKGEDFILSDEIVDELYN